MIAKSLSSCREAQSPRKFCCSDGNSATIIYLSGNISFLPLSMNYSQVTMVHVISAAGENV
jgi:hypothetical protein